MRALGITRCDPHGRTLCTESVDGEHAQTTGLFCTPTLPHRRARARACVRQVCARARASLSAQVNERVLCAPDEHAHVHTWQTPRRLGSVQVCVCVCVVHLPSKGAHERSPRGQFKCARAHAISQKVMLVFAPCERYLCVCVCVRLRARTVLCAARVRVSV